MCTFRPILSAVFLCLCLAAGGSSAGTISGTVVVKAAEKSSPPRRYYMGPYRSGRRHAAPAARGPGDVVVYLEGMAGRPAPSPPAPPPVMRQKDETFIPHVLPVQAGTAVAFPNEDDFYHNVFSVMAGDRFDLGRYARGDTVYQTFARPGVVVVRCEIHPDMKAFIRVLETPCFTVPGEDGGFAFRGIPAGTYTLRAWHPTQGEQTRAVTVPDSGAVGVDFSF